MEFISKSLLEYSENHSSSENKLLHELNRETHLKVNMPRMLSGHLQGRYLSFLSKMLQPSCILEIGTYTGYSALCLAEGLKSGGTLISIDNNPETNKVAKKYCEKSPFASQIQLLLGNAMDLIPQLAIKPDLVFIDADKSNYSNYFDLIFDKVVPGGVIIADNVLWSGKVLEEKKDKDTEAIHQFNEKIRNSKGLECLLLPVRDGLMMIRKF
ncbi:MAG TPA: O-methyltransferase [Bacteroidia bacterium]|nr:O-methyltransferase [Bacteroidia bacterium]